MKTIFALACGMLAAMGLQAQEQHTTVITEFNLAGPLAVGAPLLIDTADVQGKAFDAARLLDAIGPATPATGQFTGAVLPSLDGSRSVGLLQFWVNNSSYVKGTLTVKGPEHLQVYVDGEKSDGQLRLAPEHHSIAISYLAEAGAADSISVTIEANRAVESTLSDAHPYMLHDLTDGRRVRGISLSADGAFVLLSFQTTERDGSSHWDYELRDTRTQRLLGRPQQSVSWMPRTIAYLEETDEGGHRTLYKNDPRTGERTRWATHLPKGGYAVSPTEDYLVFTATEEGPKEDEDVFEVVEMDDRQPGWRTRSYLLRYDVATATTQRLTFGHYTQQLSDISADGRQLLVLSSRSRLERRPTEVESAFLMQADGTSPADTLFADQGFVGQCWFSPTGRQVLVKGTPEAFDRVGCQLPATATPSMTEGELFLYDLGSRQVTPLTKDFDPSVEDVAWSTADGMIYFSAEDRDYVHLYRLNPATGAISLLPLEGDDTYRWTLADHAPTMAYLSYKTMEPASAYLAQLGQKKLAAVKLFDGATALGSAQLGQCQEWNFQSQRGYTVTGRLYLPHDFDPQKKYPMIVYYYGGCSPVSRYFESPYAPQMWNSLGYVAYIVEPSGATGFGQEWASRHVNTAGRGPADDIIEGVEKICQAHPFIDKDKIGCMGASYGGFMTQYLQTVTDLFACAVSHAGISNHTSYWGEGYWGYNYSEVSMAGSYPWSHRQLYVDQSPLFNADKIHTPLLLLHGNADTNVPLIESLQMFTALKLLGREVALVEVEGQNHHILDYKKRAKWLATQMAWFQKWLKDDPSWWDALYPKKNL